MINNDQITLLLHCFNDIKSRRSGGNTVFWSERTHGGYISFDELACLNIGSLRSTTWQAPRRVVNI